MTFLEKGKLLRLKQTFLIVQQKRNSSAFQLNGTKSCCKSDEIFLPHRNDFSTKNRPAPDEWISKKQFWKFMWIILSNFPLFLCIEWN